MLIIFVTRQEQCGGVEGDRDDWAPVRRLNSPWARPPWPLPPPLHSTPPFVWSERNPTLWIKFRSQQTSSITAVNLENVWENCDFSGLFRNLCWLSRALGFSSDNCTIVMKTRTFNGWKKSNSNFDSIAKECQMRLLLQSFKQNQKFPSESSLFLWPLWLQSTLLSLWHHCCDCHYRDCDHQW